jgi:signal transduction histidine kinase
VIVLSFYLAEKVTRPLLDITNQISKYNFDEVTIPVKIQDSNKEVALLAVRFNELMQKMNEAFSFQKHAIHHISHELKTPIAVLVSNFDRIERETDIVQIKQLVEEQKEGTLALSEIINSLLEMAKVESGTHPLMEQLRIDELLYDIVAELNTLYPDFVFQLEYAFDLAQMEELQLTIRGNERLLRSALTNLLLNSILYNSKNTTRIVIGETQQHVSVKIENEGIVIPFHEQPFLFQHFYRGESSKGIRGFGLGLVFVQKIMKIHEGSVTYKTEGKHTNVFILSMPLS